jgi:hypothetical protein
MNAQVLDVWGMTSLLTVTALWSTRVDTPPHRTTAATLAPQGFYPDWWTVPTITYVSETWVMKRTDQNQSQKVRAVFKNCIFSNYLLVDKNRSEDEILFFWDVT